MKKDIQQSIFKIITGFGTGSGFLLNGHNFIITNYHVVDGSKEVAVEDHRKDRYLAKVVMVNPEVDLAFLQIANYQNSIDGIYLDENLAVSNMQKVYINGYPFGMPYTVTEGIVSSPNQPMNNRHYVQTDAAVNPGNSGGPMINADGALIGVTTSKFNNADNMGFGIKHTDLLHEITTFNFLDDLYRVKCNSCDSYIETKSRFCTNCGNNIDDALFDEFELSHFANFVESTLNELGMNPILGRAGKDFWEFHQGSALVRIFVYKRDYLVATSPLNKLPKQNLNELFQYLLEGHVAPYMLGVSNNTIYISYRAHLSDIFSNRATEIKQNLKNLAIKADELDHFFMEKFGAELAIESKV